jgi:ubiquinone/menaquinone biosynthesis C-methylase UbiE
MAFAPRVREVIGLDVSDGMLAEAARKALDQGFRNVTFQKAPAESLPFPNDSFQYVTCRVASHHFVSVSRFCDESFRVLKSGGRLLVADTSVPEGSPVVDQWQNRVEAVRDTSHVRNYSPHEWRAFTTDAGFHVEALAELKEGAPMSLRDWMKKSGCEGKAAKEVVRLFAEAPEEARKRFRIVEQPDGDVTFQWMRVVLAARKP